MNYTEIIKNYLIDFDKLEVGQTLWSVIDGEVKVLEKKDDKFYVRSGFHRKDGKQFKINKYPTLFTSNPFANLQRVETQNANIR